MFSLSTTWNAGTAGSGAEIVEQYQRLGINSVELGYNLDTAQVEEFIRMSDAGRLIITSVHNFCPVPKGYDPFEFKPDFFSLSSPKESQRQQAVAFTLRSLKTAVRARAHGGPLRPD